MFGSKRQGKIYTVRFKFYGYNGKTKNDNFKPIEMQKIEFYNKDTAHQEIKNLCNKKANCTNGTIFYTFDVNGKTIYAIDSTLKNLSYADILKTYESDLERAKIVNSVINNIPEIEVSFDVWEYVGENTIGSYKNEHYEIEVNNYVITFYLEVSEKGIEKGGYNDPTEYTKKNDKVWVDDLEIKNSDCELLELTETEYKKAVNEIIKNVIF